MSIIPSKKIPKEFFFDGIYDTEYGIPAEFRKNSVSTEYGIPQYGILYSAEFRITEFRMLRNSVKYGIPLDTLVADCWPARHYTYIY